MPISQSLQSIARNPNQSSKYAMMKMVKPMGETTFNDVASKIYKVKTKNK